MNARVKLNNSEAFNRSLIKILEHSRGPVEKTMRKQTKLIIEKVLSVTPPANGSTQGVKARRAGEKTTAGNILKVMKGVPVSRDRNRLSQVKDRDIYRQHEKHRKRGRVRRSLGRSKATVPTRMLKQYIKRRQAAVGMLAAGWNAAAKEFKASGRYHPAWVKRHSPKSSASIRVLPDSIRIRFTNATRYAGKVSVMKGRLDWAMKKQAFNNEKIIANFKGGARRAGFSVR